MNQPSDTPINHNLPVVSVSELSAALKSHIEERFDHVRIRGEISGLHRAGSGHVYFSLKDERALIEAACWRPVVPKLPPQLEDGADVIVTGRITTYPTRSRYQVIVEAVELAGVGALLKLLEDRKRKLAEEGLFSEARKRPLPYIPECIGVITSPTGAVIRDILHRLQDRFPRHVLVWPVAVQGQDAAAQIAAAIKGFNALDVRSSVRRPDLLIVARGGGSLEDLWPFNEEIVVRAVAASAIPTISAVGHETDTTLIDFASDRRAPTPTAAAEVSVPVRHDLLANLLTCQKRLMDASSRLVADYRFRATAVSRGLVRASRMPTEFQQQLDHWSDRLRQSPRLALLKASQALSDVGKRLIDPNTLVAPLVNRLTIDTRGLDNSFRAAMANKRHTLDLAGSLLESCSYKKTLARGFAIVEDAQGTLVTSVYRLRAGDMIQVRLGDGSRRAVIRDRQSSSRAGGASNARTDENQGNLL